MKTKGNDPRQFGLITARISGQEWPNRYLCTKEKVANEKCNNKVSLRKTRKTPEEVAWYLRQVHLESLLTSNSDNNKRKCIQARGHAIGYKLRSRYSSTLLARLVEAATLINYFIYFTLFANRMWQNASVGSINSSKLSFSIQLRFQTPLPEKSSFLFKIC